jgi:hypothetical protein
MVQDFLDGLMLDEVVVDGRVAITGHQRERMVNLLNKVMRKIEQRIRADVNGFAWRVSIQNKRINEIVARDRCTVSSLARFHQASA